MVEVWGIILGLRRIKTQNKWKSTVSVGFVMVTPA